MRNIIVQGIFSLKQCRTVECSFLSFHTFSKNVWHSCHCKFPNSIWITILNKWKASIHNPKIFSTYSYIWMFKVCLEISPSIILQSTTHYAYKMPFAIYRRGSKRQTTYRVNVKISMIWWKRVVKKIGMLLGCVISLKSHWSDMPLVRPYTRPVTTLHHFQTLATLITGLVYGWTNGMSD